MRRVVSPGVYLPRGVACRVISPAVRIADAIMFSRSPICSWSAVSGRLAGAPPLTRVGGALASDRVAGALVGLRPPGAMLLERGVRVRVLLVIETSST